MKKLLTIIAVACMAVVAQAASVNWSSYVYNADMTAGINGGTYWVVALGESDDDLADLVVYTDGTTSWDESIQVGTGDITSANASGTIDNLTSLNSNTYYALIVWDGVEGEGGYYGVASRLIGTVVDNSPTPLNPIAFDNSGYNQGMMLTNKATVTIPEPTVLALLALGVAGLALRRRA